MILENYFISESRSLHLNRRNDPPKEVPGMVVLETLRQEDLEFTVSLGYIARLSQIK
jgi:hypothetical protein